MPFDGNAIKELFKIIKTPYVLIALILWSGLLLFLPNEIIKKIYMETFRNNFGGIIGAVFIISLCLLLTIVISFIYKYLKKIIINKINKKNQIKYLLNLEEEKAKILKKFIKTSDHTLALSYNNGITLEFNSFGIIQQAGATQAVSFGYEDEMILKYFLQPWVMNLINENEDLKKKYCNK